MSEHHNHAHDAEGSLVSGRRLTEEQAAEVAARVAELAKAGLPLAPGLRALAGELGSGRVSRVLVEIAGRLDAGNSLEDALRAQGDRFPAHLRGLILAGVGSGRLPCVLEQYVAIQRQRSQLRRRIWMSMAYPTLLLTMVLLLFLFFSMVIVPQFAKIYSDFGTQLPVITRMLISISRPGMRVVVCLPAFALYLALLLATTRVPLWGRRALYSVPVFGTLWRLSGMLSLARLLGLFVDEQVPLPDALRFTAQGLPEPDLAIACWDAARRVRDGRSLSEALACDWQFLPTLRMFAAWGQQSACLAESLRAAAKVFERRLDVQIRLCDSVVPAIMFLLVIGSALFLVAALMMPMISLITMLAM